MAFKVMRDGVTWCVLGMIWCGGQGKESRQNLASQRLIRLLTGQIHQNRHLRVIWMILTADKMVVNGSIAICLKLCWKKSIPLHYQQGINPSDWLSCFSFTSCVPLFSMFSAFSFSFTSRGLLLLFLLSCYVVGLFSCLLQ